MQRSMNWRRRLPEVFAPDERPGADTHVYCKGCGEPLDGQARHLPGRTQVTVMMCLPCQERHEHALIPASNSPSVCYRCGGPDTLFVARKHFPVTYHICARCVPERAKRYRAGNFDQLPVPPESAPTIRMP